MAIETIVIFVIAAAALAILLYFFLSTTNPSLNLIQLKAEQSKWCNSYITHDPDCEDVDDVDQSITDELLNVCMNLHTVEGGYEQCSDPINIACVRQCCLQCPEA